MRRREMKSIILIVLLSVFYSSICFAETGYKPAIVESQDGKKYEIVETDAERVEKGGIFSGGDNIKLGAIEAVQGNIRIKCYVRELEKKLIAVTIQIFNDSKSETLKAQSFPIVSLMDADNTVCRPVDPSAVADVFMAGGRINGELAYLNTSSEPNNAYDVTISGTSQGSQGYKSFQGTGRAVPRMTIGSGIQSAGNSIARGAAIGRAKRRARAANAAILTAYSAGEIPPSSNMVGNFYYYPNKSSSVSFKVQVEEKVFNFQFNR